MDGPIEQLKHGRPSSIAIRRGRLRPVTWADAHDAAALGRLAAWHAAAFPGGPGAVTAEGVRQWLLHRVMGNPRRALLWVEDAAGTAVGHVGLSALWEAEAVDRLASAPAQEGLIRVAATALLRWAKRAGMSPSGGATFSSAGIA